MGLVIKRVYEPADARDGTRILVDWLWPRGVTRDKVDLWLKDIAPSDAPRKRLHGADGDWEAFRAAYFVELESSAARTMFECLARGTVTLLYAARDEKRNNAVALKVWLEHQTDGQ